tara:strand:- start:1406 stop:2515 length:1110 start_codon:yes stop_codon:yes gene_type:complete
MKWIGQHIWDFISRFRSDVYLEATESGTIASGGNLGLDANNKIVKATSGSGDLTITNATDNRVVTSTGGTGLNAESNLTFDGSAFTATATSAAFTNTASFVVGANSGPSFILSNTANDSAGPILTLRNTRGDTDASDGDDLGTISFIGKDDGTPSDQTYAQIVAEIGDATSGQEAGDLSFKVAEYDGTLTTGLFLDGDTNADGEVDVTIGAGAASTTTIAGDLTVASKATVPTRKYELPSSTVGDYKGGDVYYYGDGSTVKGGIYYIDGTNWTLADADAEASTSGLLAVALGTDPDVDGMLLRGFVTLLTEIEGTEAIGSPVYLSATDSGKATITVPASGDFVRVLGYSLHASDNQVYFNPDNTWVERA